jgi:hypothetical protein
MNAHQRRLEKRRAKRRSAVTFTFVENTNTHDRSVRQYMYDWLAAMEKSKNPTLVSEYAASSGDLCDNLRAEGYPYAAQQVEEKLGRHARVWPVNAKDGEANDPVILNVSFSYGGAPP